MKRGVFIVLAAWAITGFPGWATGAEKYPNKPVTIVVPIGAGGMTDVTARLLAEKFKTELGQPFLIQNKPGASGAIGLKYFLSQKPDGYTVLVSPISDNLAAPYFNAMEPFNVKDFSFVGGYMLQERILFTNVDKPYKTFEEFIEYAKKHPGEISAGSAGIQWPLEVIKSIAAKNGLAMKYVMFKSGAEASTAVMGRHVDVAETGNGAPAFQAAREGKLNYLVNLGSQEVPFFPQCRNLKQLGYPFTTSIEYGIALRAGTPEDIRKKLQDTLAKTLAIPEIKEKLEAMGMPPRFLDGQKFESTVSEAVKSIPLLMKYNSVLPKT
ncbi:MAG TPA: tripartite tricarboxylate transporter substrate binding protein [Thermodesulfobacteriota bacterium]|nr:tripartite tricarboxylate transporter substrate binding protein [Thermodesulfobacteriota bacterium]